MPEARGTPHGRPRLGEGAAAQARASRETPEEAEARRRRKREAYVREVKRRWHHCFLEEVGAARPPTPPTSPRSLSKRGFDAAVQEWRKALAERVGPLRVIQVEGEESGAAKQEESEDGWRQALPE